MGKQGHHEFAAAQETVTAGSERIFGIVFACVFGIVAVFPMFGGGEPYIWAVLVAVGFLLVALLYPALLSPLNKLWFRLGLLLHQIVNPLVMGIIFFVVVTPIGLLFKLTGKDPLKLRWSADDESYWVGRNPPGPDPVSMKRQF
jgi:hypothetical protein